MRKFKKITAVILAAAACVLLTACGGGSGKAKDIDVADLADELNKDTVTAETRSETQADMLKNIYFFEDGQVTDSKAYASSGATADEICVVKCKDEATTADVEKLFETRRDNQSQLYASYNPDESDKLNKAIIKSSDVYSVFVVCDDYDKADKILDSYGF